MLAKLQKSIQDLKARKHDGGFTLIELLIVVLIIGILAAIVIVAVGNQQGTAKAKACSADAAAMVAAMDRFVLENGDVVPTATGGTAPTPTNGTGDVTGYLAYQDTDLTGFTVTGGTKKFIPDYLKSLPGNYGTDVILIGDSTNKRVAALCQLDGATNSGI